MQPEGRASNTALHILYAWGVLPQIINKNLRRKKRITETLQISFQKKIGQKGQTGSTVTKKYFHCFHYFHYLHCVHCLNTDQTVQWRICLYLLLVLVRVTGWISALSTFSISYLRKWLILTVKLAGLLITPLTAISIRPPAALKSYRFRVPSFKKPSPLYGQNLQWRMLTKPRLQVVQITRCSGSK